MCHAVKPYEMVKGFLDEYVHWTWRIVRKINQICITGLGDYAKIDPERGNVKLPTRV